MDLIQKQFITNKMYSTVLYNCIVQIFWMAHSSPAALELYSKFHANSSAGYSSGFVLPQFKGQGL